MTNTVTTKTGEKIDISKFKYFGQFGNYVRQNIDKHWGGAKDLETKKLKRYEVKLSASIEAVGYCYKTVEAEKEDDAEEIAREEVTRGDWDIDDIQDVDDIEIDNIEELDEDAE